MSARNEALHAEFTRWLGRYSPRRALQQNEQALGDEINALMRMVLKMAPNSDYLRWLEKVTTNLDFQMKTSAWPTVAEVGAACSNMNKHAALNSPKPRHSQQKRPMDIASDRMKNGDFVGDEWIYGRNAVEMMSEGLVDQETLRKYRSALYFSAKAVYGDEIAKRREAEWIAKHESAESHHKLAAGDMPTGEPFQRMPTHDNDQWAAE